MPARRRGEAKSLPTPAKPRTLTFPSFPPPTNNSGDSLAMPPDPSPQTLIAPSAPLLCRLGYAPHPTVRRQRRRSSNSTSTLSWFPMSPLGPDAEPCAVTEGERSTPLRNGSGTLDTSNHTGQRFSTSLSPSSASIPPPAVQRHTKPELPKLHTITSNGSSIPIVPRDKHGRPILPLNLDIVTINCLGEVCMRDYFHTERYIANDMADGSIICRHGYWCLVDRSACGGPRSKQAAQQFCLCARLLRLEAKHDQASNSGTPRHRLRDYVWQNFVDGRPLGPNRHVTSFLHLLNDGCDYDRPNSGSRDPTSLQSFQLTNSRLLTPSMGCQLCRTSVDGPEQLGLKTGR
ncbi:hypothetical protein EDB89DRAFT_1564830 [Lactarius sanguifluus]|nr:hypothetical protein EDB89DRAFT_1564830 [Lactarius sanguifluus]